MVSEEDIKILEEYTTDLFHSYKGEVILKATRNLLQGYKELKEDNKQWKKYCTEDLEEQIAELNDKVFKLEMDRENSIPTSLVEEKLQEIDKMIEKINKGELQRYTVGELLLIKRVLEELLKGGN